MPDCQRCVKPINSATHIIITRIVDYGYRLIPEYEIDHESEEEFEPRNTDGLYLCATCYQKYTGDI